jgi:hypothetical protein
MLKPMFRLTPVVLPWALVKKDTPRLFPSPMLQDGADPVGTFMPTSTPAPKESHSGHGKAGITGVISFFVL